jgi:hypothetical protein
MRDELPDYSSDPTTYHRIYYHVVRRRKLIEALGGACVRCGATDDLQFDHINPAEKAMEIKSNLSFKAVGDELKKCQLLCRTCHLGKTVGEKAPFRHGTIYGFMKMKCQCAACTVRQREWYDARNARRLKPNGRGAYGPRTK